MTYSPRIKIDNKLVAWYQLEGNALDSSLNSKNAAIRGSLSYIPTANDLVTPHGYFYASGFNDSNYVKLPLSIGSGLTQYAIEIILAGPTTNITGICPYSRGGEGVLGANFHGFETILSGGVLALRWMDRTSGVERPIMASKPLTVGGIAQGTNGYAISVDGTSRQTFLDSSLVAFDNFGQPFDANAVSHSIGASISGYGHAWSGCIKELRIYNYAKTSFEAVAQTDFQDSAHVDVPDTTYNIQMYDSSFTPLLTGAWSPIIQIANPPIWYITNVGPNGNNYMPGYVADSATDLLMMKNGLVVGKAKITGIYLLDEYTFI